MGCDCKLHSFFQFYHHRKINWIAIIYDVYVCYCHSVTEVAPVASKSILPFNFWLIYENFYFRLNKDTLFSAHLATSCKCQPRHKSKCHCTKLHGIVKQIYIDKGNFDGRWAVGALSQVFTPGWRGIVVTVRAVGRPGGRAGGCQTCGTHIFVTAWRIFSIRSFVELTRPVVVHCHGHLPTCPIWACPQATNLSNSPQIGSRLCGTHISETAGWI